MVEYFNLTGFASNEGLMGFWVTLSDLMGQWFGVFLLSIIFTISLIAMIKRGEKTGEKDINTYFLVSSLYTMLTSIVFYLAQIIKSSLFIFIPTVIFVLTVALKWYHTD